MEIQTISDRHWTLDPGLQRYFLGACILCSICFAVGVFASIFSWTDDGVPLALRIIGGLVGASGAISALFLWMSMLLYWWQLYRTEHGTNWFWLILLVAGNWVGATAFYFFIFKRIARQQLGENSF